MADQITDMILCSLNYFVSGEQLTGTEIPEGKWQVKVAAIANVTLSEPENTLHSDGAATLGCFNDSVVVEKQGHDGTVSTNHNCQRQTTTEGEWNPRPSAYQPSYCLTATPSWPPN